MSARRRALGPALVAALALLLGACSLEDDRSPRNISPGDGAPELDSEVSSTQAPLGASLRLYLLAPSSSGQNERLQAVPRLVEATPGAVFSSLVAGPAPGDPDDLRTAIPTGVELVSAPQLRSGVLTIDVSQEIFEATGSTLIEAMAQIVFTLCELDSVDRVLVTVDGQRRDWPIGDGSLTGEPLSEFDYPELNPTSQPDFPAQPAPGSATTSTTTQPKNTSATSS